MKTTTHSCHAGGYLLSLAIDVRVVPVVPPEADHDAHRPPRVAVEPIMDVEAIPVGVGSIHC